jgi:peptidoglycan/LPS O-acetylase OafA/YrhL
MLIGNATYSIYLIHNPLQMIVLRFMPHIHSIIGVFIGLFLVFLTTFIFGYAYYLIFEKKMISIIKTKLSI